LSKLRRRIVAAGTGRVYAACRLRCHRRAAIPWRRIACPFNELRGDDGFAIAVLRQRERRLAIAVPGRVDAWPAETFVVGCEPQDPNEPCLELPPAVPAAVTPAVRQVERC
jgi:hypothetical protein